MDHIVLTPNLLIFIEFVIVGSIRYLFLISALIRFIRYYKSGYFNRKVHQWSSSFCIKILVNLVIATNYGSMGLLFFNSLEYFSYLFFVNSFTWLASISLLYFEYRRKLPQSWTGLRSFWLCNGLIYLIKIIFIYALADIDPKLSKFQEMYVVQLFFSLVLLYFSLFKPRDHETKLNPSLGAEHTFPEGEPSGQFTVTPNDNSKAYGQHKKTNSEDKKTFQFIELQIVEIKQRKFSKLGDSLIPRNREEENALENKKLRFSTRVRIPEALRNQMKKKESQKTFVSKKNLKEILEFNEYIIDKFENNNMNKIISPLMIQLRNITTIFFKSFSKDLNSSISNTLGNYTSKLRSLEQIYINLCKNYSFFTIEFLKFLDIRDDEFVEFLVKNFNNERTNFVYRNDYDKIFDSTNKKSIGSGHTGSSKGFSCKVKIKNDRTNDSFYSEFESHVADTTSNDLMKTMNFINNIITSEKFLSISVKGIKERGNLLESIIICGITFDSQMSESSVSLNISVNRIYEYISNENSALKNASQFIELKSLAKDVRNFMQIKKENNEFKNKLSSALTSIANDLFFLDEKLFEMLELNKIIKLDINEIDMQIVNSFFQLDRRSSLDVLIFDNNFLKEKNLSNYKISSKVDRIESDESSCAIILHIEMTSEHIQDGGNLQTSWEVSIKLNDLLVLITEIIDINSALERFEDMVQFLRNMSKTIDVILKILCEPSKSHRSNCNLNKDRDAECSNLLNDLIHQFEKLFIQPYNYVLYSQPLRSMLKIKNVFKGEEKEEMDNEKEKKKCNFSGSSSSLLENLLS